MIVVKLEVKVINGWIRYLEKKTEMVTSTFISCKVYISEARNKSALELIERAAKLHPEVVVVNKFEDEIYNRVGYTLVSKSSTSLSLKNAVFSMVKAAFESINFELHSGNHPRLGVVDHICFLPLGSASLEQVANIAKALAADIGSILQVPTYTCGAANSDQRSLDFIRRELGYFRPNKYGYEWSGGPQSEVLQVAPDEGPAQVVRTNGVVVIEATKWFANFNVPVFSSDIGIVRRIAKRVSGRGGGLPLVQSLALVHGESVVEVACTLLEPSEVGGDQVQGAVERLGRDEGVTVGKGYFTDLSQEEQIQTYFKLFLTS